MANRFRLDRTIAPIHYTITIEPDLKRFTFRGYEMITIRARAPFSRITLHAAELNIRRAAVHLGASPTAKALRAKRITYDATLETATLHFGRTIRPAQGLVLSLAFTGGINDKMRGFYRTSYAVRGQARWGGATQFEATDARRAFPCWDEPDCKATFTLALRVPRHLTALSNMPVARQRPLPGTPLREITYRPTPRMSTYLLAWVIAELECVAGRDANGVPIRVWTTPGKKAQGRFGLAVGKKSLEYFASWFNIPYALPKLDMVALPDFAAGAMENWGLVTYRETTLLVDPEHSSAPAKQRVAEVVAHELAHQWFGNLVTMTWWTDLWLNEGFASYMDPKANAAHFPSWQIWNQFVAGEYSLALRDDSLKHSHPIEIPVKNPHEIREIFDHITYNKGSAVNRMLEHYLTEPVFRRGLSRYLKRYAYRNARTQDLWAALEEVSGKPVRAIMATYTRKAGYPVVSVAPAPGGVRLAQRRFSFDGRLDGAGIRWTVPLVIAVQGRRQPSYALLRGSQATLKAPAEGWIKVNTGHSGFYRTAYAPELFARLTRAVARGELSTLDCFGLLDDTLALARAGAMRTSQALDLSAQAAKRYADYNVYATISGIVGSVEHLLEAEPARAALLAFTRDAFGPLARRVGWEPRPADGHLDALLRSLLIARMGHARDPATVAEARDRFARFLKTGALDPNLRGPVYGIVAEFGGRREYDQLMRVYRKASLQEERVRVLRALTNFREPPLIRTALAFSLSKDVRKQDAYMILGGFGHNPVGRPLAWEFITRHWTPLRTRFSDGGLRMMTYILDGSTSSFATPQALADVRRFFADHPVPGTERTMKQSLEVISATIRWAARDTGDLRAWLARRH